jgi:drug/metabolite transporter (DMT)-like permease
VPVVLALVAALAYGVSDFLAALASRRFGVLRATTIGYLTALVAIVLLWSTSPGLWSAGAALSGAVAGVLAVVGFLGFYSALAIGPMSVLSPFMSVLGALVPVGIALGRGERLTPLAITAIVVAVLAGALVSVTRERASRIPLRALLCAVVGGVGLGSSVAAIDAAPSGSGLVPGVVETAVGVVILVVVSIMRRGATRAAAAETGASRTPHAQAVVAGALLGLANGLLVLALAGGGGLAVVSVLVNLYPVVTVLLATIIARERMAAIQVVGVVLAFAASTTLVLA